MTALASCSGLVLVTLAITYRLAVVSAVVSRRSLAIRIHCLGTSGADIVTSGWWAGQFSAAFGQHLIGLGAVRRGEQVGEASSCHAGRPVEWAARVPLRCRAVLTRPTWLNACGVLPT